MDSKSRRVEIRVFDYPFFSNLSQAEKIFYWFVICNCDNVGVYQHNRKLAEFHCQGEIDLDTFIDKVNLSEKRMEKIGNGKIWIPNFVQDTWGTIAAGNNLGLSCYKLLVKHGLLGRFISEHLNSINVASFREYIKENKKGYETLPLPQACPSPDPKNGEYEGLGEDALTQASPKPASINITNNIVKKLSNTTVDKAQSILDDYPKKNKGGSDISTLATIEDVLKVLKTEEIKDPEGYLRNEIDKLDRRDAPAPDQFFEGFLQRKEIPF